VGCAGIVDAPEPPGAGAVVAAGAGALVGAGVGAAQALNAETNNVKATNVMALVLMYLSPIGRYCDTATAFVRSAAPS
jgi:hypothetical protein